MGKLLDVGTLASLRQRPIYLCYAGLVWIQVDSQVDIRHSCCASVRIELVAPISEWREKASLVRISFVSRPPPLLFPRDILSSISLPCIFTKIMAPKGSSSESQTPSDPDEDSVSSSVKMAVKAPQREGSHAALKEEAWAKHLPTFRRLYVDEGYTLKQVMDFMETKHNFKASYDELKDKSPV